MPLEWDTVHFPAQHIMRWACTCKRPRFASERRTLVSACRTRCCDNVSIVTVRCQPLSSLLLIRCRGGGVQGWAVAARLTRKKHREPHRSHSFVLTPTLSSSLLDCFLFSNKPDFSLLLMCLLVCVTSIHNNIIIIFLTPPFTHLLSALSGPPWQACEEEEEE